MVSYLQEEAGLDWEGIVEEFTIEVLLGVLAVYHCYSSVIELRTSCSSDHLQQVSGLEVDIFVSLCVEVLSSFDEDETSREVDSPSKRRCCDHDLDLVLYEKLLT